MPLLVLYTDHIANANHGIRTPLFANANFGRCFTRTPCFSLYIGIFACQSLREEVARLKQQLTQVLTTTFYKYHGT